jgi:exo-beta-1,3-glucanase (GH17 family)
MQASSKQDSHVMNIVRPFRASCTRLLALPFVSCALLAACGQNQNYGQNAAFVKIGGTVSGLSGALGLSQNGVDSLSVTANGAFTFALQIASGSGYAVSISAQPTGQTCTVANGGGTTTSNVTSVAITCVNDPTVGGTLSGLGAGATLVLEDNGGDKLSLTANGSFTFKTALTLGAAYSVTVATQPAGATCNVTNGSGTASAAVTNVAVTCAVTPTIGGTVSGLNSGTLVLADNGGDDLSLTGNGPFTFATPLSVGASYAVSVATQPAALNCTVGNGSGTANANVTNVAVTCAAFTLRPLPAIFHTGKAVAYSAYRAGGPGAGEIPTDAEVLQDLQLLHTAGFNLLRMFGADAVADKILNLAQANYPDIKFQVGSYLEGSSSACDDTLNATEIAKSIELANTYPNVVAVSVGNETSFAGNLPVACLVGYIKTVRSQVSQPVTADDDYTFYAGLSGSGEKPDTVLPNLDYVSFHTYPFSDTGLWDWQQTGAAAGPARAAAMMNASLVQVQSTYQQVASYSYVGANGATTTVGASLPITIGETGWKATPTRPSASIEAVVNPAIANPVNAKWYDDLLASWTGAGAPVAIFYFEAFDEAWKGQDDGWGLWDSGRNARYGLCATPAAASACNADLYSGAGYFH